MKQKLLLVLMLLPLVWVSTAQAKVYKCKNAEGKMDFRSSACPEGAMDQDGKKVDPNKPQPKIEHPYSEGRRLNCRKSYWFYSGLCIHKSYMSPDSKLMSERVDHFKMFDKLLDETKVKEKPSKK